MSDQNPFNCRFVQVWLKGPVKGVFLENPRIQPLGDRSFVVGQLTFKDGTEDARAGLTAWVLVEDVAILTEFPDKALMDKSSAESEARRAAH
jgi:hypothetical protein